MANLEHNELKLIELLPLGNQQPRPAKNLAIMLGVDTRHVRLLVNHLITDHHLPIGASQHAPTGYYWITSEQERLWAMAPLSSQINKMNQRLTALSDSLLISKHEAINGDEPIKQTTLNI
ncbi:hypothetical protein [Limosilactobacillus ingluviei]|uniref:hypothetical protein n=1 Tax=Limosilactobacillus ingluviei TaxID=148604 RepID=UPI0024B9C3A7|nr:hypothetical protein [Limosilactobacillus ingluviei]